MDGVAQSPNRSGEKSRFQTFTSKTTSTSWRVWTVEEPIFPGLSGLLKENPIGMVMAKPSVMRRVSLSLQQRAGVTDEGVIRPDSLRGKSHKSDSPLVFWEGSSQVSNPFGRNKQTRNRGREINKKMNEKKAKLFQGIKKNQKCITQ